jgi:hypothetical protein
MTPRVTVVKNVAGESPNCGYVAESEHEFSLCPTLPQLSREIQMRGDPPETRREQGQDRDTVSRKEELEREKREQDEKQKRERERRDTQR